MKSVTSVCARYFVVLTAAFSLGLVLARVTPVAAQTGPVHATISPTPTFVFEDLDMVAETYSLYWEHACSGALRTSFTKVNASPAHAALEQVLDSCDNFNTEIEVSLCYYSSNQIVAVTAIVLRANGTQENVVLQPSCSNCEEPTFTLFDSGSVADAIVAAHVTTSFGKIAWATLDYWSPGVANGQVHQWGEYTSECEEYGPLVFLDQVVPGSNCTTGPWRILVMVQDSCPGQDYEGAPVYAIYGQNQQVLIGELDSTGFFMSACTVTTMPEAIGVGGFVSARRLYAGAHCCCP